MRFLSRCARLGALALLAWIALPRAAGAASVLPWIADDYPKALALAKQRHVPIFVENWAPW